MLILLAERCRPEERARVLETVRAHGCQVVELAHGGRTLLSVEGDLDHLRQVPLAMYPGVERVIPLTAPYTLASWKHQPQPTVVRVGRARIGGGGFCVVAGPCAVEDEDTLLATARAVKEAGAHVLRGGAWKPRTSPYAFRGLGLEGLRMLRDVGREVDLPTVTEVTDPRHVEAVVSSADMLQIGTRNMSNFDLLVEVGRSGHPVLLKRGRSATISDWLLAAEYVLAQGNEQLVLCERGVRGFDPATRNLLDLAAVPALRARTHLPVLVDPSHATGHAAYVPPLARAALAAGADGLMVEVHVAPETARSDAEQALPPRIFAELCDDLRLLERALGATRTARRAAADEV
jgi:3-deoxy-7-phosphoheptulonate synthase